MKCLANLGLMFGLVMGVNVNAKTTEDSYLFSLPIKATLRVAKDIVFSAYQKQIYLQAGRLVEDIKSIEKTKAFCSLELKQTRTKDSILAKEKTLSVDKIDNQSYSSIRGPVRMVSVYFLHPNVEKLVCHSGEYDTDHLSQRDLESDIAAGFLQIVIPKPEEL